MSISFSCSATDILPMNYVSLHQSAVRSLQWIKIPNVSADGKLQTFMDPTIVASGGYDGCVTFTDLRDCNGNTITRTRGQPLSLFTEH